MAQDLWYEIVFVHQDGVVQTLDITKTLKEAKAQLKFFLKIYSIVRIIKNTVR